MEADPARPQAQPNPREEKFNSFRRRIYAVQDGGETVEEVYDDWAETYEELVLIMGYEAPTNLAPVVADVLPDRSSRILDAASGVGMLGKELKALGYTCIDALDPSCASLNKCKESGAYTEYICDTLDEHQTKIADYYYDAVVICGSFGIPGHVDLSCFPEMIRIIKPGGYAILTMSTKVAEEWDDRLEARIREESERGTIELVEHRWISYHTHQNLSEKAKVPILRVL